MRSTTPCRLAVLAAATAAMAGIQLAPAAGAADLVPAIKAAARTFVLETTVAQGTSVTFVNADPIRHDVTAYDQGPGGGPLFRSAIIGTGTTPVVGADALPPGSYAFYCSLHDGMTGILTVE